MANYPKWFAGMTLRDYAQRDSVWEIRVPEATAKLYFAAADKAARDATAIGLLLTALLTCTKMKEVGRFCRVVDEQAPVAAADVGVARGNKIVLFGETGPEGWRLSIPGRDETAYTLKTNDVMIDIEAAGDLADFITLLEAAALGTTTGLAVSVTSAEIND